MTKPLKIAKCNHHLSLILDALRVGLMIPLIDDPSAPLSFSEEEEEECIKSGVF